MSETDTAYCRFCAKSKPYGKLVNLQTDVDRRQKVLKKLWRLSLEVAHLNSPHDALPKTVCFPCIESLNSAFEFVINVEACQGELMAFGLAEIKQEVLNGEKSTSDTQLCREPTLKVEFEVSDEEVRRDSQINTQYTEITCNFGIPHNPEIHTQVSEIKTENFEIDTQNSEVKAHDIEINSNRENAKVVIKEESRNDNCLDKKLLAESQLSWKDYSWLCAYCDIMFPTIDELKQHAIQSHGCCNPYRCTDCKVRKLNLDGFVTHVRQHRPHLRLSCYRCHKTFLRHYDAIVHKKEHLVSEFRCPGCDETFATNEQCLEHCNMYNKDRKIREVPAEQLTEDLKCVFCQKQFRYKGGLTTHLLTQHREQKRDHTCDKCGKCFLNKANLTGHMLMHDDIRPYECEICKHCFRQRSQLSRHMGTHDGKKPFTCDKCGRCFRLKKQLNTHSIVHTEDFPYICSYCKKGFKHKSTFIQHVRLHTGERPYKCHVCDNDFTNWPNYNKHMKRRHGMNMAKSQQSLEHSTTVQVEIDQPTDLSMKSKNNFVPKCRGRPKLIKSTKQKILCNEIKTEATYS